MKRQWLKILAQSVVIATMVGLGPASLAAEAAAPVYLVDDDGAQCPSAAYTNITSPFPLQDAITDAIANGVKTVAVCGGVYPRFAVDGANGLTIKAFDPAIRPEIDAPPANDWDYVIQVTNSINVVLDGLLITRTNSGDAAGGLMYGIAYYGSSGTIQNNIVRNMADTDLSSGNGTAVLIYHTDPGGPSTAKVTVRNNLIDRYATFGIRAAGRVTMTISGNVLNGNRGIGPAQPYYGIFVTGSNSQGIPKGTISQNKISQANNGIFLDETGGLSISGNVISDSGWAGIYIQSRCWDTSAHASKNKISGNTILRSAQYAIQLNAEESDPNSQCDPWIDQTLISKNTFVATLLTQPRAILMSLYQYGSAHTAMISKTQITGNTAWGYSAISDQSAGVQTTTFKSNVLVHP